MSRMNIEINIFTNKTTYAEAYNYTKELLYYNDKVMNMYKHKVTKGLKITALIVNDNFIVNNDRKTSFKQYAERRS